ncbi:protein phosphatase regulator [Coemansia brasiliensis]|uniref:Protein phosphatase regulator n=1 Tax=Coemansia brasiliensis TaxID=2650707 RepID=A0A9W8ICN3_9FUNG|nr:protein phosphatase regulator [Coemansia brasiliensis]
MNFQGLEFDGVPTDSDILSDDNDSVSSLVDEDVDFGYVYALFNFPQMVEGQITVEEGEKLTLLDDSNSYWWLVQNLRDNQMGYIPADNIETAFGKLARVNRRKNLKLCQPDPEHIVQAPPKPKKNRQVAFDDHPVTQVFVSPDTDDDDESDDEYDAYEDEDMDTRRTEPAVVPSQDIDDDNDSIDYSSYYYSADADDTDPASPGNTRRVSIAPMSMGNIAGEIHDSDSDTDDMRRHSAGSGIAAMYADRRESTLLLPTEDGTPTYYLSNEESDDGDSLSGVLNRVNDSHDIAAPGKYTLRIQHVDMVDTKDAKISLFQDELLSEVLRRALAVFGMSPGNESSLVLYAQFGTSDLALLPSDSQVSILLNRLRDAYGSEPLPKAGEIGANICTLLLADRSVPLAQLLGTVAMDEEDPYEGMETGSRSILRTSVAASVSEGITSLASHEAISTTHTSEPSSSFTTRPVLERPLSPGNSSSSPESSQILLEESDNLPDSRSVVQGLLRSIPRPTSQPPPSAVNRAKRNTLQISAQGSVVDHDFGASLSPQPQASRSTLSRSASTHIAAQSDSAPAPPEPMQALGHSASTLRPSSDTMGHDDSEPSSPSDGHMSPDENVGSHSPAESSDTASSHQDGSEDAAPSVAAAAALTALAHSAPHRLLKEASDVNGMSQPVPAELSLDDWLVIMRGWGDTHDASASNAAFYRSFLNDIDPADSQFADTHSYISSHVTQLADMRSPADDILSLSQGVGRHLDTLERELDDIARILVHAN